MNLFLRVILERFRGWREQLLLRQGELLVLRWQDVDLDAGMLVVQNPATSSPGLAFLLATIHEYGLDGWQDYWRALGANGVEVVEGWTEAYYERFTWAGGGPTPMVVSYGSSPPAEVIFADPPRDDAPTGVVEDTCFRQVEFADPHTAAVVERDPRGPAHGVQERVQYGPVGDGVAAVLHALRLAVG